MAVLPASEDRGMGRSRLPRRSGSGAVMKRERASAGYTGETVTAGFPAMPASGRTLTEYDTWLAVTHRSLTGRPNPPVGGRWVRAERPMPVGEGQSRCGLVRPTG